MSSSWFRGQNASATPVLRWMSASLPRTRSKPSEKKSPERNLGAFLLGDQHTHDEFLRALTVANHPLDAIAGGGRGGGRSRGDGQRARYGDLIGGRGNGQAAARLRRNC